MSRQEVVCPQCQKMYVPINGKKYCTRSCYHASRKGKVVVGLAMGWEQKRKEKQESLDRPCLSCGKKLLDGLQEMSVMSEWAYRKRQVCSRACLMAHRVANDVMPSGAIVTQGDAGVRCNICGGIFVQLSSHMKAKHGFSGTRETRGMERLALYRMKMGERCAAKRFITEVQDSSRARGAGREGWRDEESFRQANAAYRELRQQLRGSVPQGSDRQRRSAREVILRGETQRHNAYQSAVYRLVTHCLLCNGEILTTYGRARANGHARMYCSRKCAARVNRQPQVKAGLRDAIEKRKEEFALNERIRFESSLPVAIR